ncbi:MAG: 50S ribosomal protein L29 [Planctomycetes bacterium]|nr:50S ribosomal protein L29 [Planctomycetota bacterium]MCB9871675.1 50S ribosomal protein L29 [Planctomycetota bacterium]
MKAIRGRDDEELHDDLRHLQKEVFLLSLHGLGEAKNPARKRQIRRQIARIHTVLGERGRGVTHNAKES